MATRAVITGLGPVTSIGIGRSEFDRSLRNGASGISPARTPAIQGFAVGLAGEVHDFDQSDWIEQSAGGLGHCAALAIAGATLAIRDAGLPETGDWRDSACVSIGTTDGEAHATDEMMVHWVRAGAAEVPSELVRRSAAEGLAVSMAPSWTLAARQSRWRRPALRETMQLGMRST